MEEIEYDPIDVPESWDPARDRCCDRCKDRCSRADVLSILQERASTFDGSNDLCIRCHQIGFFSNVRDESDCLASKDDMLFDKFQFSIGTLEQIRNRKCAGCRLIHLSATQSRGSVDDSVLASPMLRPRILYRDAREGSAPEEHNHRETDRILEIIINNSKHGRRIDWITVGAIAQGGSLCDAPSQTLKASLFSGAQQSIEGRILGSTIDFELLKEWISFCDTRHPQCQFRQNTAGSLVQIRLLDLHTMRIFYGNTADNYAALSYQWGADTLPLLTKDTYEKFTAPAGVNEAELPATIADAVKVTKALGLPFLWVDTLCVVQNDPRDKQEQLPLMETIYRSADVVIIAAMGENASAGIAGTGNALRSIGQFQEVVNGHRYVTIYPQLQQVLRRSRWNSRGWTFQEAMLSRRALIFTEHATYWSCQQEPWRDDLCTESGSWQSVFDEDNCLHNAQIVEPVQISPINSSLIRHSCCPTAKYCRLVTAFSRRSFTNASDALWAFQGVLRHYLSDFKSGYIWALPKDSLDATLLWYEDTGCNGAHLRYAKHTINSERGVVKLEYPSYSWLSCDISVSFLPSCKDAVVSRVEWHKHPVEKLYLLRPSTEARAQNGATPWHENDTITDFGILLFTAEVAYLTLTVEGELPKSKWAKTSASIQAPDGRKIGRLKILSGMFHGQQRRSAAFALMSSNIEPAEKRGNCNEWPLYEQIGTLPVSHNLMLIEPTRPIAYRWGLAIVNAAEWEGIETEKMRIALR